MNYRTNSVERLADKIISGVARTTLYAPRTTVTEGSK